MHTNEPIIMSSAPTSCSRRCLNLLEKCKNMKHLKQAHAQAFTCALTNNSNTLSRILAFCSHPTHGNLHHARKLFQHIQNPTICIYNTMIKAFLLRDQIFEVFNLYVTMLQNGMYPDNYTLPYVLKACAKFECCFLGESVHGYCLKVGFGDIIVANSLILMYSSGIFSDMRAARYVFDEMPSPCVVSWTLMISGFAKVGDVTIFI
ncbi:pentatricopeptide repeat-containing protein At1g08070, chloroplastic-like [Mercurialis annua]|uniref:pentatricopeptide repeat-containing protein At1g08070, chloroplastic-like n=1 Tax=Mercurialis annua TaxID=3986 RepID=UPI0021603ABC|nr:pentatricopeptide repeat-containing protein At1g08070, chloroplastic-like [Mercurialis annua]